MSWRFRQSFTILPGLRLNLSKSGLSASIGGAPFTMNIGQHGITETVSIPGTGLSYRHHVEPTHQGPSQNGADPPLPLPSLLELDQPSLTNTTPIENIHSASTELLTSETLKDVKRLIQTAFKQHEEVKRDLDIAQSEKLEANSRYEKWERGFLFKLLFKRAFARRKEDFETAVAKVAELEEQMSLSTITTHIEVDKEQADLFYRLRDDFAALSECASIWDVKSHQATDKFHERTVAAFKVVRDRVKFTLASCDLIQWDEKVPHLQNAKGGDLYLYPGFILYRAAREAFSLIEYHDVSGNASMLSFHEEEAVPADSNVVGHTWAKCNRDGSRDKRFVNNYQIPIAQYGLVTLKSQNGLWEEFHFSDPQKMVNFFMSLRAFTSSFEAVADA